ncbi:VIT and vWA domain-containing protein [Stratiformator vulcanicus]|uniref:von Willebrand factor type A domain protein n=1 Tax=Stratiformator vulcanicus TaxID=2527980 RepID=A0A517R0I0_9PLAN|nr:VIT and VWA domain-containing protein [Stratiformator vulcanicus]QDT37330.1 von Willebrand factor type A domain protein [Stratiformator vulcanicus]
MRTLIAIAASLTISFASNHASACFVRSPQPVQVWVDQVAIDIRGNVAEKHYVCGFKNPNGGAIVGGECYMELEPGSQVDALTVSVDGSKTTAEILPVEEANEVFKNIVKEGGSPALLEYFGNQLIRTKLPNIPAGQVVTVDLRYTTVLKRHGDFLRVRCLNTNPKPLQQKLKKAGVKVRIKSAEPIKAVYSPTHPVEIEEEKDWDVVVKWSEEDYLPKYPFVLYVKSAKQALGAGLLTHHPPGEDGSFMLLLSPGHGSAATPDWLQTGVPKDIVFCVDTSGSMLKDRKIEQLKQALTYCVSELREGDRFNIVDFNTGVRSMAKSGLVESNDETEATALDYVDRLHARGGTAIKDALDQSLLLLSAGRTEDAAVTPMIVFVTDGLPTIGELEPDKILKETSKLNSDGVRLFVFGQGYGVNARLLDQLAKQNSGEADYALPDEKIEDFIKPFFDRVGTPVLSNVSVEIEGVETYDIYPRTVTDLYRGEQLILVGRYRGSGAGKVVLRGQSSDGEQVLKYDVEFSAEAVSEDNAFLPRLWAGRRIDELLSIAAGQDPAPAEIIEEVVGLATRYGIITPYTSFLIEERPGTSGGAAAAEEQAGRVRRDLRRFWGKSSEFNSSLDRGKAQKQNVEDAKAAALARKNSSLSGNASDLYRQAADELSKSSLSGQKKSALDAVQFIADRTFYQRNGRWEQAEFPNHAVAKLNTVELGGDAYFELLKKDALAARYLALGNVVVNLDGEWYEVK